jgi:hypothetical protein
MTPIVSSIRWIRWSAALLGVALVAGCASVGQPPAADIAARSPDARECADWFATLDRSIDAADVRDAGTYRVPGFPYLRADRFSASFRAEAAAGGPAFDVWLARLRGLDLTARRYEVTNLPEAAATRLDPGGKPAIEARTASCSALLAREDLAVAQRRDLLLARAAVPDDYAGWVHLTGIYALASGPFAAGVDGWQKEAHEMFGKAEAGEAYASDLQRYSAAGEPVGADQVGAILARVPRDALGVPQFASEDLDVLFRAYAPEYQIQTKGPYDRFGHLIWTSAEAPQVDATQPLVYRRLAYTRHGGETLVQLVYTVWFSERPPSKTPDMLAGKLDGLVFRVTLDSAGRPLVYDTIHPCGCYHMFVPTARAKARPAPDPREEWALIPATLPEMGVAQRVAVRVASGSHHLVRVGPAGEPASERYGFAEDDDLRALPLPGGQTRSVFGPDALVAGSERPERFLFWPMGIASPGTMRQWGRHPTAFLGRRHFDDADLVDKRFEVVEPPSVASAAGAARADLPRE